MHNVIVNIEFFMSIVLRRLNIVNEIGRWTFCMEKRLSIEDIEKCCGENEYVSEWFPIGGTLIRKTDGSKRFCGIGFIDVGNGLFVADTVFNVNEKQNFEYAERNGVHDLS
ncbi:hypothetical protein PFISCL1PPCAC_26314 [Pristionchus fissidentatus]|uniref:RNA binding protein n=1 Tax=Pristionchus fissidentatus TaxID=1538716 RepID=A0AAV5WSK9_9BILA|nr:hypothetical protein PFISCL1PPCAC_26314 [Pristionchus fissidentatus]